MVLIRKVCKFMQSSDEMVAAGPRAMVGGASLR